MKKPLMEANRTAPELTKILTGSRPEHVVNIRLKGKAPAGLDSANKIPEKINPDWKFGLNGKERYENRT